MNKKKSIISIFLIISFQKYNLELNNAWTGSLLPGRSLSPRISYYPAGDEPKTKEQGFSGIRPKSDPDPSELDSILEI
jgi:hypothetical protein